MGVTSLSQPTGEAYDEASTHANLFHSLEQTRDMEDDPLSCKQLILGVCMQGTEVASSLSHEDLWQFVLHDEPELRCAAGRIGVHTGMHVGVALPVHAAETCVALLHTMTYACAVPLNPEYSPAEIARDMDGCQVRNCPKDRWERPQMIRAQVFLPAVGGARNDTAQ